MLGDGWRPLSDYVYDRKYVYAAAVNHRQRHSISHRILAPLYVTHCHRPKGVDPYNAANTLPSRSSTAHQSPFTSPGPPSAGLAPGIRPLCRHVRRAVLRERGQR